MESSPFYDYTKLVRKKYKKSSNEISSNYIVGGMQYSALYPAKKRGSIVKPTNEMVQIAPSILAPNGTKRFMKLYFKFLFEYNLAKYLV